MENELIEIGEICNYYGGLHIKKEDSKCYWAIENYDGFYWEEIPESLYSELLLFKNKEQK